MSVAHLARLPHRHRRPTIRTTFYTYSNSDSSYTRLWVLELRPLDGAHFSLAPERGRSICYRLTPE